MNKVVLELHIFPWSETHGYPWEEVLRSFDAHQMFYWFKERPLQNSSPSHRSQSLIASQAFHMLLMKNEPCMVTGSCMMRRVWKPIPFQERLLTRKPEDMQCRTKIFQASSPVMARIIHLAHRARPCFCVESRPRPPDSFGRQQKSQATLWKPWWSKLESLRKSLRKISNLW